jgi:hypothetical protein
VTDGSIRFLAGLSLAALAAITGIVSYLHALTVVYITGSAGLVAYLIPFVADLMIVTASLAILDAIRHHAPKPPLAMVSLVAGIGSTLAMNIVAGLHISAGGALVAALPPVAFVLSLETLMASSGWHAQATARATSRPPTVNARTRWPCRLRTRLLPPTSTRVTASASPCRSASYRPSSACRGPRWPRWSEPSTGRGPTTQRKTLRNESR